MDNTYTLKFAGTADISSWMELVTLVRYNFPSLEIDEELEKHRQTVLKNMERGSAICVTADDCVVGVLLFSDNRHCISCMAVHPLHRKKGIASAMIEKMLSVLSPERDVFVTTFREGDEKGIAPRALYKKFGFVEDELLIEHGYPNQKFILHRILAQKGRTR